MHIKKVKEVIKKDKYTANHISTEIYQYYISYIREHYQSIEIEKVIEECGLTYDYVMDSSNWVSVSFDAAFMDKIVELTDNSSLTYDVGIYSMKVTSDNLAIKILQLFFDTTDAYRLVKNFSPKFNQICKFEIHNVTNNGLSMKIVPTLRKLNSEEHDVLLAKSLANIVDNTKGWLEQLPASLYGLNPAKVEYSKFDENSYIFDIKFENRPKRRSKVIYFFTLLSLFGLSFFGFDLIDESNFFLLKYIIFAFIFGAASVPNLLIKRWIEGDIVKMMESQIEDSSIRYEELYRNNRELNLIRNFVNDLIKERSLERSYQAVCERIKENFGYDMVGLFIHSKESNLIEYKASVGLSDAQNDLISQLKLPVHIDDPQPWKFTTIFQNQSSILILDIDTYAKSIQGRQIIDLINPGSIVISSIYSDDNRFGLLVVASSEGCKLLDERDHSLVKGVCSQFSVILEKHLDNEEKLKIAAENVKMKDEFLATISHEMKTPLNGVIRLSDISMRMTEDQKIHDNLKIVKSSGERLSRMVGGILKVAGEQSKNDSFIGNKVHLPDIFDRVFMLLAAAEQKIEADYQIDPACADIYGDGDKIEQIFLNLVKNGIEAISGRGKISISCQKFESNGIVIEVTDTGSGIEEKDYERIFEQFYQVDSGVTRKKEGLGIGLSLVKKFVEMHKGRISVQSNFQLTKFTMTLPNAFLKSNNDRLEKRYNSHSTPEISATESVVNRSLSEKGRDLCVLIVDDIKDIHEVVRQEIQLTNESWDVVSAYSGEEALEMIEQGVVPNLIILDVHMPGYDGFQVATKIRERYVQAEMPIIFYTGHTEDYEKANAVGGNDFIRKGQYTFEEFSATLNNNMHISIYTKQSKLFVPSEKLKYLGYNSILDVRLGDYAFQDLAVVVFDIRNFTRILNSMNNDEMINFVSLAFKDFVPDLFKGAFIDKYTGDGALLCFKTIPEAVKFCVNEIQSLRYAEEKILGPKLAKSIGMRSAAGIHFGELLLVNIGHETRIENTVYGMSVNIAARLEGVNKKFGSSITIFADQADQCGFMTRPLGKHYLKGVRNDEAIAIVEVLDVYEKEEFLLRKSYNDLFINGVELFEEGDYAAAERVFKEIILQNSNDGAVKYFIDELGMVRKKGA